MPVHLNHTIVAAHDKYESARFLTEMLGLTAEPVEFGPFVGVEVDNGVTFDFADDHHESEITPQHYAFLVTEAEFDEIYGRIVERGLEHWADPFQNQPGAINHNDGGRGVYWRDPAGHFLEIITRPYGSGD